VHLVGLYTHWLKQPWNSLLILWIIHSIVTEN
jgi:hypothetical protein